MKKMVTAFALAFVAASMVQAKVVSLGEDSLLVSGEAPNQANTPTSQKVIKDPAEYNAYITALNTQDPAARAAAMEAFVKQYPQSVVLTDALEQAMAAYQQSGNQAKVEDTANRILKLDPNNIRALAIVVFIKRVHATQQGDLQLAKETAALAQSGLAALSSWPRPEGVTEPEFQKLRSQMADIFNGAAGFGALQAKDYANARTYYEKAFQIDPTNLQDVYQLAVADLQMNPIDVNGFWYCSKAINLAQRQNNSAVVQGMAPYCKAKYQRYRGGEDGWDEIVAVTANQNALPPDFPSHIKPAPTPCELAVQAVQQNDPATLSFSDWEFILQRRDCSPANKDAADKVWKAIQDKQKGGEAKLKIPVKVIAATKDSIDAAITDENQQADKADLHVVLEKPALHPPAPGSMTDIIGEITNYAPNPFVFTMEEGELPVPPKPASPKRPAKRP